MIPLIPSCFPEVLEQLKDDPTVRKDCHDLFKRFKISVAPILYGIFKSFFPNRLGVAEMKSEAEYLLFVCIIRLYVNNRQLTLLPDQEITNLIRTTARNICLSLFEKNNTSKKREKPADFSNPILANRFTANAIAWDQKEFRTHILEFISSLPEKQFLVFYYKAFEGWSHKDIGEALEISEKNSKSTYSQARKVVVRAFGNLYDDLFPNNERNIGL